MTNTDHQSITTSTRIVALTTEQAQLPLPDDRQPAIAYLAGIGMLIAERDATGWSFELRIGLATLDQGDAPLLGWAVGTLPSDAHVVGWQLAETSIPALLSAANDAEPELATAFLDSLAGAISGGSTDLAVEQGGAGAPSFQAHASRLGLLVHRIARGAVFEAYHSARTAPVHTAIASELLALMHLVLLAGGAAKSDARRDFGRWLSEQRALGADV